ncbi:MAG TPA: hypothetical protein VGO48_10390 [Conexibacter sp.]|jgi:hypothetical protein|nr:hypothetical protein [Conexibacter sp.]
MAAIDKPLTPSRQQVAAERIAGYGAEQQRLKAAAAARRKAAAREEEQRAASFSVRRQRSMPTDRPSRYLR